MTGAPGYTLFVEDEAARANALLSRGDMEAVMVVHLAGRAAERLVMGEGEVRLYCCKRRCIERRHSLPEQPVAGFRVS